MGLGDLVESYEVIMGIYGTGNRTKNCTPTSSVNTTLQELVGSGLCPHILRRNQKVVAI